VFILSVRFVEYCAGVFVWGLEVCAHLVVGGVCVAGVRGGGLRCWGLCVFVFNSLRGLDNLRRDLITNLQERRSYSTVLKNLQALCAAGYSVLYVFRGCWSHCLLLTEGRAAKTTVLSVASGEVQQKTRLWLL